MPEGLLEAITDVDCGSSKWGRNLFLAANASTTCKFLWLISLVQRTSVVGEVYTSSLPELRTLAQVSLFSFSTMCRNSNENVMRSQLFMRDAIVDGSC